MKRELLALVGMVFAQPALGNEPITGVPYVIDGDTLSFGRVYVRLLDIDAPEKDQTCTDGGGTPYYCGVVATDFLKRILRGASVTCEGSSKDRYGRLLATCKVGNADIGTIMVMDGWAVVYHQRSSVLMVYQHDAERQRLGIWQGKFDWPWEWREQRKAHATPTPFQRQR